LSGDSNQLSAKVGSFISNSLFNCAVIKFDLTSRIILISVLEATCLEVGWGQDDSMISDDSDEIGEEETIG